MKAQGGHGANPSAFMRSRGRGCVPRARARRGCGAYSWALGPSVSTLWSGLVMDLFQV